MIALHVGCMPVRMSTGMAMVTVMTVARVRVRVRVRVRQFYLATCCTVGMLRSLRPRLCLALCFLSDATGRVPSVSARSFTARVFLLSESYSRG